MMGGASSMLQNMGGAIFGMQLGQAIGALSAEVVSSTDIGVPAGRPGNGAAARQRGEIRRRPEPARERHPAVPRRPRGSPRPAVRPGPLAARPSARRDRGLRRGASTSTPPGSRNSPGSWIRATPKASRRPCPRASSCRSAPPRRNRPSKSWRRPSPWWRAGWTNSPPPPRRSCCPPPPRCAKRSAAAAPPAVPAEHAFSSLVGLELRPRRLREAATLWASLKAERGIEGRDAIWKHPDLLPTAEDLDDPAGLQRTPQARRGQRQRGRRRPPEAANGGFDEPGPRPATRHGRKREARARGRTGGEGDDRGGERHGRRARGQDAMAPAGLRLPPASSSSAVGASPREVAKETPSRKALARSVSGYASSSRQNAALWPATSRCASSCSST